MKKNLMKEAHKMTREIVSRYGDVDYKTQLGLCLSFLSQEQEKEEETVEMYKRIEVARDDINSYWRGEIFNDGKTAWKVTRIKRQIEGLLYGYYDDFYFTVDLENITNTVEGQKEIEKHNVIEAWKNGTLELKSKYEVIAKNTGIALTIEVEEKNGEVIATKITAGDKVIGSGIVHKVHTRLCIGLEGKSLKNFLKLAGITKKLQKAECEIDCVELYWALSVVKKRNSK